VDLKKLWNRRAKKKELIYGEADFCCELEI
jgi:hypothetical protein